LPGVSDVTVIGPAIPDFDFVAPPFFDAHVAVKAVIALPLAAPAPNDTLSDPAAILTAFTPLGAAGDPTMVAGDGSGAALVRFALVGRTVHVYDFAVVVPETLIGPAAADAVFAAPPPADVHVTA